MCLVTLVSCFIRRVCPWFVFRACMESHTSCSLHHICSNKSRLNRFEVLLELLVCYSNDVLPGHSSHLAGERAPFLLGHRLDGDSTA